MNEEGPGGLMSCTTKGRRLKLPGRRGPGRFLGVAIGWHSLGVVAIVVLPSVPYQVGQPFHILNPPAVHHYHPPQGEYLHALRPSLVCSLLGAGVALLPAASLHSVLFLPVRRLPHLLSIVFATRPILSVKCPLLLSRIPASFWLNGRNLPLGRS